MTPLDFLNLLWPNKPEELQLLIWTLQDKRSHWFRSLPDAAEFLQTHQIDVYVGVGLAKQDRGPDHRCVSAEIAAISGLWADFDIKSPAHPKELPASIEEALTIIPESLPPTIIVATGNGLQAWWLFREPWIFESENDRKEAEILSFRFQNLLSYRSSQHGWGFDKLGDLARILRIPGTANGKDPSNLKPITVRSVADYRYNASDIEDYLDRLSIPDPTTKQAGNNWAERFADTDLAIDLNARIPQERLDPWLASDPRFKNTWFRQRKNLNDQSQSGYDMALACFGVGVGLSPQEIMDLIVHHRREHRVQPRTRLDYFQRTIAKAEKSRSQDSGLRAHQMNPPGSDGTGSSSTPGSQQEEESGPIDPAMARAKNWEQLSNALGIHIFRLIKITGADPIYRMEVEGGKISFSNIRKLSSQEFFRRTVAAAINKYPRKLKPNLWEEVAQLMLDSLTEEDGGEEMQLEGSANLHICQYLSEVEFIEAVEGQSKHNARKPLIIDGCVTVCSNELHTYIAKTTGQNLSIQQVVAMLSAVGAKIHRHHKKSVDQKRWKLPPSEFDPNIHSAHYREDLNRGE